MAPFGTGEPLELAETSWSLATSTAGGTWVSKDIPMMLHLFEHIVRGALLKWWEWMANSRT
jgi:hypothetical protein